MINIPLSLSPLVAGIIWLIVWVANPKPPFPVWILILIAGGTLLFIILNFLAFHRVRLERDSLIFTPPHNRDALIGAMLNAKQAALAIQGCYSKIGGLITRTKDKTLSYEDIYETINNPSEKLMNAMRILDTEILTAGTNYARIFEDVRSTLILPLLFKGLLSLTGKVIGNDSDLLEFEDCLDNSINKAIAAMDGREIEGYTTWNLEDYINSLARKPGLTSHNEGVNEL